MAGITIIRPNDRDCATAQTSGMAREAGVSSETCGATTIWSGFVSTPPGVASGVHHHGDCETAIYVISGRARFRFGEKLEHAVEVGAGDFLFVPPNEIHQEENLSETEPCELIVSRGFSGILTVNVPDPREGAGS